MEAIMVYKLMGVGLYLAVLLGIGAAASQKMTDVKDYFAAGKSLGFWSVAFSARATGESAWLLLGLTGMGAMLGVKAFWVVVGEVLGVVGAWLLMARPFHRLTMQYDSITIPDFLESRFDDSSHALRLVSAIALVVFVTIYVSAQIDATGAAFETFLGWNYFAGVAVGFGVVMAYSVTGGFKAVVWSDIFQGVLMFLGLVGLPLFAFATFDGSIVTILADLDPSLLAPLGAEGATLTNIFGIIGLALIGLGFMGSPQIFSRFLALRSEEEIGKGALVAFVWTLLADSGAVCTGLAGRAILAPAPKDEVIGAGRLLGTGAEGVLPLLVESILSPMLVGLFIAIVLSAIMSTVDSLLILASSAAVRDVYQQVLRPDISDEALVGASRAATLGLGLVALMVAVGVALLVPGRTVFWFVVFGWSGIAATFCPAMMLSLWWSGASRNGVLAAMVTGFLSVPFFKFAPPAFGWKLLEALGELPPAFAVSLATGLVVSLLSPQPQAAR